MTKQIYQIQIVLKNSKPIIWRRILVNSETPLEDFHKIIQTTMGWTNSHLHQFEKGRTVYAPEEFELDYAKDSQKVVLSTLLKKEKDKLKYEYDFGDGWVHDITLEKILQFDKKLEIPMCLDGKRNCPPEDCGGMMGYENLLKIISDTKHKEHKETIEWLGGGFEAEYFDTVEINEMLQDDDYGCIYL